ncbi:MAG: hypothetical protein KBF97_01845, partial [Bacteroidetes bacterium]|nr:hypothetical protein [Bacteroidota bacterium]
MNGDIVQFIKTIREAMPDMGTNKFFIPTNAHLNFFDTLFIDLKKKEYGTIAARASQYGYAFIRYVHTATGETLYVLKENTPVLRGWGTYIFDPTGANDLTIEAPHPIWDTNSWELAIRLFLRTDARWFLMAGTHRYSNSDSSSDMAHVTQSVFHMAHKRTGTSRSIQIHGFSKTGSNAGYPDVVISNGTQSPPSILFSLSASYSGKGFTSGVFSSTTYADLKNLGATTNKQGQWSNSNGKLFVHIEHDNPLRTNQTKQAQSIEAVYETFTPPASAGTVNDATVSHFALHGNFPNPFNPSTTIRFSVPQTGLVRLTVTDVTGREVAVPVDGMMERGDHA